MDRDKYFVRICYRIARSARTSHLVQLDELGRFRDKYFVRICSDRVFPFSLPFEWLGFFLFTYYFCKEDLFLREHRQWCDRRRGERDESA